MFLSYREAKDQNIYRLRSYKNTLRLLVEKMMAELGRTINEKELSKRFWDALPADIRNTYMTPIMSLRDRIRAIYEGYPEYFEEHKQENKPYFLQKEREQKKRRQELMNQILENVPQQKSEEQSITVEHP